MGDVLDVLGAVREGRGATVGSLAEVFWTEER